jgi:hypothetical protein
MAVPMTRPNGDGASVVRCCLEDARYEAAGKASRLVAVFD